MMKVDFDDSIPLISQRVEGETSLWEIHKSMEQTSSLHSFYDAAVLWDFRAAPFVKPLEEFNAGIPKIIEGMKSRMSDRKRAFVVNEDWQRSILQDIVSSSEVSWPWTVFTNYETALSW